MRYLANKKVSCRRQCLRRRDPHQKQFVPLPFGGGHKTTSIYQWNNWYMLQLKTHKIREKKSRNTERVLLPCKNMHASLIAISDERWYTVSVIALHRLIIPKFDFNPWKTKETKQNHWTIKYTGRPVCIRCNIPSNGPSLCHTDSLSWNIMFIHETLFKITGPCHCD